MSVSLRDILKLKKEVYSKLTTHDAKTRQDIEVVFDDFIENMDNGDVTRLPKYPIYPTLPYPREITSPVTQPWIQPMSPTCVGSKPWDVTILHNKVVEAYVGGGIFGNYQELIPSGKVTFGDKVDTNG